MLIPGRGTVRRIAYALMIVIVAALLFVSALYANRLAVGPMLVPGLVVYDCVLFGAAALCGLRTVAVRRERLAWALMTAALASWLAGELYWDCVFGSVNNPPVPSVSDGFWLSVYPLAAASLVLLARSRLRKVSVEVWIVAATAALGVSAVSAATIFATALRDSHGSIGFITTELAYPIGDLVLLAIVVLVGVASGPRLFRENWMPIVGGLAVFYAADSVYLVQSLTNTYRQYGPVDIGWPLALVLISFSAWMPFRRNPERVREEIGVAPPVAFGMLGLGVLVSNYFHRTNGLAMVLAAGCIVAVGAGMILAFHYRKAAYESRLARDEAVEASNAKSLFVATVSHELRTPLNGVIGLTDMLLDSDLNDAQREYADLVRSSSEGLLAIINDILDYSRIEAGKVDIVAGDFALQETIAEAAAMLLVAARAKGITLEVTSDLELPTWLHGDAGRIRQVVVNLVSNAVKFTAHGGVSVHASATPAGAAARVRVEVTDSGIGMDADTVSKLFEPFTQADSSDTRRYGGTGLGLTISAQLVDVMGGTIGVNSRPGEGTTVWFELVLPRATSHKPPARLESQASPPVTVDVAPLVLVVEDNPVNRLVVERLLEKCGCRAESAKDGSEALSAVAHTSYDAILMDCQMPVMDGFEATREIRCREHDDEHVPIIAVTAHTQAGAEERCRDVGMDDFLNKPLREAALREALVRAMPDRVELFERRAATGAALTL